MAWKQGLKLPLLSQYDKVCALLTLVALLFSLVRLTQSSVERGARKENYVQALNNLRPAHPKVLPFDMAPYDRALASLRAPALLSVSSNETAGLFVPERRVWCVECRGPISFDRTSCSFCHAEQPGSEKIVDVERDSDADGIPDVKETEWSLNPLDPTDVALDADQDGFANLQEFLAHTNPRDAESHPKLDALLRVKSIETKGFPIVLKGASRMPAGKWKAQFNLLTRTGHEDQTFWVVEGDEIGSTGLTMGAYTEKKEKRPNPRLNNMLMDVDYSTATVIRKADGRTFTLTVGDKQAIDLEAVLVLPLDGTTYPVSLGGTFKLRDEKYHVISIDNEAFAVVIKNESTGKKLTVPR